MTWINLSNRPECYLRCELTQELIPCVALAGYYHTKKQNFSKFIIEAEGIEFSVDTEELCFISNVSSIVTQVA